MTTSVRPIFATRVIGGFGEDGALAEGIYETSNIAAISLVLRLLLTSVMSLSPHPVTDFFRKFFGSFFFPTRTFEELTDESPGSSAGYAVLLFLVFLPLKYLFLTVWQPVMSAIIPHTAFDNQRFQFCPGPSYLCDPLFTTGFYAVVIIVFLTLASLLYNAIANPDTFYDKRCSQEVQRQRIHYRIEPTISQTGRVVLDCIAPLIFFSLLPWFGWFIGVAWFSWSSRRGLTAHYGKQNPMDDGFHSHYNVMIIVRSVWPGGEVANPVSQCVPFAGVSVFMLPAMFLLWK